jgi:hypothetical protein
LYPKALPLISVFLDRSESSIVGTNWRRLGKRGRSPLRLAEERKGLHSLLSTRNSFFSLDAVSS